MTSLFSRLQKKEGNVARDSGSEATARRDSPGSYGAVNADASHYQIVSCGRCGRRLKTWKGGHEVLVEGSLFCEGAMRGEQR